MLRDTSIAMTNVKKSAGKVTCALGLASPIDAQPMASQSKKGGTCLLQGLDFPNAGLINDKLEKATTDLTRRRNSQTYSNTNRGSPVKAHKRSGQTKYIVQGVCCRSFHCITAV
jgi:hypothetical protein